MQAWPSGGRLGLTSNLRIASRMGSNPGAIRCFLDQGTLHSLHSTGWFQERFGDCSISLKLSTQSN